MQLINGKERLHLIIAEYGRELSKIGKRISDLNNQNKREDNIIQKILNLINIYEEAFNQLKKVEAPLVFNPEHIKLLDSFEELITAYAIQLKSIDVNKEISKIELYLKGKSKEEEVIRKIGTILISLLSKCSSLALSENLKEFWE